MDFAPPLRVSAKPLIWNGYVKDSMKIIGDIEMDISVNKGGKERVGKLFDWEDSTIFLWSIRRLSVNPISMVFATLKMFKLPIIVFLSSLLIGIVFPRIAFWLFFIFTSGYILAYIIVVFRALILRIPDFFGPSEIWKPKSSHYIYAATICAGIAFLVLSPASIFLDGFKSPNQINIFDLILFLIDNLFQVAFIGIPEALGFKLSNISPISYKTKILVFVFRIMVAIGFIDFLAGIFRRRFLEYEFFGTLKELYATCVFFPLSIELEIRCGGVMEYVKPPEKFSFKDFIRNFHNDFKKELRENVPIAHIPPQIFSRDNFAIIAAYVLGSHWEGTATCKNCNEIHTFITKNEIERRLFLMGWPNAFCPKCKDERLDFTWKEVENS